ncbi:ISNCY family transposase [Deltaproteobacteria bacterium TL4]
MFNPNLRYSVKDAALGAFSVFFSQSPSFLSHQRQRHQSQGKNNAQTLFGIEQIPSDPQIRNLLDPVAPDELHSVFSETFEKLEQQGYLQEYRFFADYRLMALDGTDYFSSSKISCDNCSTKHHKNGKVSYSHKVLTPVVVAPKNSKVIVLEPEFLTPQDGSEKQDCELNAAKRWIEKHSHLASKQIIILGDELFSRNPFCQLLLEKGFAFILVCKPGSHKTLYEGIASREKSNELESFSIRKWNGQFHELQTYRYLKDVLLKNGDDALCVNWVELTITHTATQEIIYRNAFVTQFSLDRTKVPAIVEAGRTRWKVENENNNVLKTKGYHLEHNFGHGKESLAATLLTLKLLAFLAHTVLEFVDQVYTAVRKKLVARKTFFHDFQTLTKYLCFDNWNHLIGFMAQQLEIAILNST